jgi:recombination protein RecR
MTTLDKLIRQFERFPGIGSRQAKRFAFHILTEDPREVEALANLLRAIKASVHECPSCFRFYTNEYNATQCAICSQGTRDHSKLAIVERDSDLDAIERSGMYDGLYFVLGGTVPLLEAHENKKIRGGALKHIVETRAKEGLMEIILGFSVNPDGENTGRYVETVLKDILANYPIKISHLGRGLSTGSELEYADAETIKNALRNRS